MVLLHVTLNQQISITPFFFVLPFEGLTGPCGLAFESLTATCGLTFEGTQEFRRRKFHSNFLRL